MIKPITAQQLPECLCVIQKSYEPIAEEFGLTEQNCPYRGRAALPIEVLTSEYESGCMMFGYFVREKIVGFLSLKIHETDGIVLKVNDIVVLPEHRHKGYGKALLQFAKTKALELCAEKIRLGMIDDNKRLKSWYEAYGYITVETKNFEGAPFTVGYMECIIRNNPH